MCLRVCMFMFYCLNSRAWPSCLEGQSATRSEMVDHLYLSEITTVQGSDHGE